MGGQQTSEGCVVLAEEICRIKVIPDSQALALFCTAGRLTKYPKPRRMNPEWDRQATTPKVCGQF